jgi:glycine/D-amino acid oxidase-like deaminating enzyme
VDVCVVGAGIAGISTAHRLTREGKRVAVLDAGPVGGGETSRTTAHLASAVDDRFTEIERLHGLEGSRICAESHARAIDAIEEAVRTERLECDFERLDGYLFEGGTTRATLLRKSWRPRSGPGSRGSACSPGFRWRGSRRAASGSPGRGSSTP